MRDARLAEDVINFRLEDLESKIHLCFDALVHNLEEDDKWEAEIEAERKEWTQRQKELMERRGRTVPTEQPLRARRKHVFEEMRRIKATSAKTIQAKAEKFLPNALLATSLPTLPSFMQRHRSPSGRNDGEDVGAILEQEHPDASPTWIKYVTAELPVERMSNFTSEEKEFAVMVNKETQGRFSQLPFDLQLMVVRGYADKKEKRVQMSLDAANYIYEWRAETKSDDCLKKIDPKSLPYHNAWPTRYAGEDRYGHIITYDKVEEMDVDDLCAIDDHDILHYRTQQCEAIRLLKHRIEMRRGHRVAKHVYIMDLKALSLSKHFTRRVKNMMAPIFKVNGDAYPDSLWSLWLINTPLAFRAIWSFVSTIIDPTTRAKIRMLGGKDKYLPEMEKCGIPRSALPHDLGGEHPSLLLLDFIKETQQRFQTTGQLLPPMERSESEEHHHQHLQQQQQ